MARTSKPPRSDIRFDYRLWMKGARRLCVDIADTVLMRRDPLTPPSIWMIDGSTGRAVYKRVGNEFLQLFKEQGDLQPTDRFLDVGSGIGRVAGPLTGYLTPSARYEGIEVSPKGVAWCEKHITRRFPNFRFHRLDVYNGTYNRKGTIKASELKFPFDDGTFDFANVSSVFTHLLPADMENYIREISRVFSPGARALMTFFLLNDESMPAVEAGTVDPKFPFVIDNYRVSDKRAPERGIAYPEPYVKGLLDEAGLKIKGSIRYGSWCGRKQFLSYQDIIIAEK